MFFFLIGFTGPSGGFGGTLSMPLVGKKKVTAPTVYIILCLLGGLMVGGGRYYFIIIYLLTQYDLCP